jgi:hypothetical protein
MSIPLAVPQMQLMWLVQYPRYQDWHSRLLNTKLVEEDIFLSLSSFVNMV